MMKSLIILSALAAVLGQDYEYIDNLVDFDDAPYRSMSVPYPYQDDRENRLMNFRRKPIKNAILVNNEFNKFKQASLIQAGEIVTSLSNIPTSFLAKIGAVPAKLLASLKSALKFPIINIPAIFFGAVLTIGFCKLTNFCDKFSTIHSIMEAAKEFGTLVTSEKLDMATEFMQEAIRIYGSLPVDEENDV